MVASEAARIPLSPTIIIEPIDCIIIDGKPTAYIFFKTAGKVPLVVVAALLRNLLHVVHAQVDVCATLVDAEQHLVRIDRIRQRIQSCLLYTSRCV